MLRAMYRAAAIPRILRLECPMVSTLAETLLTQFLSYASQKGWTMQNARDRALLLASYGKESAIHALAQCGTGLAMVFTIATFGANSAHDEVLTASRHESARGLLVVEQASIAHRREIYERRKLAYEIRAQAFVPSLSR
jgi:hypothetical protein